MSGDGSTWQSEPDDQGLPDPLGGEASPLTADDFRACFGEDLCRALDLSTWHPGIDLTEVYRCLAEEVRRAVETETRLQQDIRDRVFHYLRTAPCSPPGAGCHAVTAGEIELVQRELLFAGGVEACDGTVEVSDSLPLTIYHIGVRLVSYQGNQGSWRQQLFRRDLHRSNGDVVGDALAALARRGRRSGLNHEDDPLSELARRAVMSYAERAVLLRRSQAPWRMGHGNVAPLEVLIGGGSADMMIESVKVIRDLVLGHRKFVFVTSEPSNQLMKTIGGALRPLEYAIVARLNERFEGRLRRARYSRPASVDATWDGKVLSPTQWILRFLAEVASQVVVGVYRATLLSPPQVFYAHAEHAEVAARVALADSVLNEMKGFPMLIDLADQMCQSECTGGNLRTLTEAAFAEAGVPYQFFSERMLRQRR